MPMARTNTVFVSTGPPQSHFGQSSEEWPPRPERALRLASLGATNRLRRAMLSAVQVAVSRDLSRRMHCARRDQLDLVWESGQWQAFT